MTEANPFHAWRKKKGLRPTEAAIQCSVERVTWWRWEKGMSKVDVGMLDHVSKVTGIPRAKLRPDIFKTAGAQ